MAGQKNGLAESASKRPEAPVPQAPRGSFSRPGPAIPRRVAPQQSPTPFHQARKAYHPLAAQDAGLPKTGQTRPPAPGTDGQRSHGDSTASGTSRNRFRRPHYPLNQHHPQDIVNRNPTSVHLSVLTRPFVAGSDAPGDSSSPCWWPSSCETSFPAGRPSTSEGSLNSLRERTLSRRFHGVGKRCNLSNG